MRVDYRRPLQTHPAVERLRQFIRWFVILAAMYTLYVVTAAVPVDTAIEQVHEQKRSRVLQMLGNSPIAQIFPFFKAYSSVTDGIDTLLLLDEDRDTIRELLIKAGIEPTPQNITAAAHYFVSKSTVIQSTAAQARKHVVRNVNIEKLRQGHQMMMQPQLPPSVAR